MIDVSKEKFTRNLHQSAKSIFENTRSTAYGEKKPTGRPNTVMTPNSYYYEKDDYRNFTRVGPEIDLSTRLLCKQNNCFQNILFFFYWKSKPLNRSITEHPKQSDFASTIRVAKRKEDHPNCVDKKKIITFSDFNTADFIVNE